MSHELLRPPSIGALVRAVRRPASVAVRLRSRPEPVAVETLVDGVRVGLDGEDWPLDGEGRPLLGLAQLNLLDAPFVPESLAGVAALTVFLARDGDGLAIPDGPAGGTWLVRAYASLDGLGPMAERPPPAPNVRSVPGAWPGGASRMCRPTTT